MGGLAHKLWASWVVSWLGRGVAASGALIIRLGHRFETACYRPFVRAFSNVLPLALLAILPCSLSCVAAHTAQAPNANPPGHTLPTEPDRFSFLQFASTRTEDLTRCHRDFFLKASASARTVLELTIRPDGAVEDVRVVESTLDDPKATECMVRSVSAWRTPFRPAKPTIFRYPYRIVAEDLSGPLK